VGAVYRQKELRRPGEISVKRLKRLELSTFCMAKYQQTVEYR
jgi:hypothetical protein